MRRAEDRTFLGSMAPIAIAGVSPEVDRQNTIGGRHILGRRASRIDERRKPSCVSRKNQCEDLF